MVYKVLGGAVVPVGGACRFHNTMAPGVDGTHHGCGEFSGVNGTPLLRGLEFTHAPSQAGERMAGMGRKGKLERCKKVTHPMD